MSINEQIEAAWKEQIPNARKWLQCSRESQILRAAGFGFEEGYRAALRSLYQEIEPSEMVVGRYYWVGGMIGEAQGFRSIKGKDGITRRWPIVNGMETCPDLFVIRGPIPNGSSLPSPSEVFGEEGV